MLEIPDEAFLNACGMTGTLRLVAEGREGLPTEVWAGSRPFALIGRDANADLRLDHGSISRRHVYLQAVEGRLFGIDLGSRTGVRRLGQPWRDGWLEPGDVLGIGPYGARVEESGTGRLEDLPSGANRHGPFSSCFKARDKLPGVSLEISAGRAVLTHWRMSRVMVLVGNSPGCKLRIVEQNVANFHCSLIRTGAGLWVVDLLGDGGTFLNGRYVRAARLEHGDDLQVGRALIRIRLDDSPPNGRSRSLQALGSSTATTMPAAGNPGDARATANGPRPWLIPFAGGGLAPDVPAVPFGLMQQQMFDQFHQIMMGIIQSFGAMHREQMEAVRDDLDRLDQITQELQELRAKSAGTLRGPGETPTPIINKISTETSVANERAGLTDATSRVGRSSQDFTDSSPTPPTASKLDPIEVLRKVQELQEARQGHWQRIVGYLFGAP